MLDFPAEQMLQQIEPIMQTPNITMVGSEIVSPMKQDDQTTHQETIQQQSQIIDELKSKIEISEQQLSHSENRFLTIQQNLKEAEERAEKMEAELKRYKYINETLEQTINQLNETHNSKILQGQENENELKKNLESSQQEILSIKSLQKSTNDEIMNKLNQSNK